MAVVVKKHPVYVALDLEKVGNAMCHPIVQVGIVIGSNGKVLEKKRWSLLYNSDAENNLTALFSDEWKQAYNAAVDRCKREFWDPRKPLWDDIQKEARKPAVVYKEIAGFIDDLYEKYKGENLLWLSDNPAYDLGHLDFWLLSSGSRFSCCRIGPGDTYHCVQDPSEQMEGLDEKTRCRVLEKFDLATAKLKEHWADDDAEIVLQLRFAIERTLAENKAAELEDTPLLGN